MKRIELTQGQYAIVDDEDYEYLNQWKWYYRSDGYAVRHELKNHDRTIWMHRVVNKTAQNMMTDHINQNKLDNRKGNLRSCLRSHNSMNRKLLKSNTSGYKGVSWKKSHKRWVSRITVNGTLKNIGYYIDKKSAALAYNRAAKKYFGEFALLNKIKEV